MGLRTQNTKLMKEEDRHPSTGNSMNEGAEWEGAWPE